MRVKGVGWGRSLYPTPLKRVRACPSLLEPLSSLTLHSESLFTGSGEKRNGQEAVATSHRPIRHSHERMAQIKDRCG